MSENLLLIVFIFFFGREAKLHGVIGFKDVRSGLESLSLSSSPVSGISDSHVTTGPRSSDMDALQAVPFDVFCRRVLIMDSRLIETLRDENRADRIGEPNTRMADRISSPKVKGCKAVGRPL